MIAVRAGARFAMSIGLAVACIAAAWCGEAAAAPVWRLVSASNTTVAPGGTIDFQVSARNLGDVPVNNGDAYRLTVTLPAGFEGLSYTGNAPFFDCGVVAGETVITCTGDAFTAPYSSQDVTITASVDPSAAGVRTARFLVEGGGALGPASTVDPVAVTPTPPGFGIDAFDATVAADPAGTPLTQAAGHPDHVTMSIDFNTATDPDPAEGRLRTVEPPKTIVVDLPPGFVGNPLAADRCTITELTNADSSDTPVPLCPPTSQIGTVMLQHSGSTNPNVTAPNEIGPLPVYNVVPPADVPLRFAFIAARELVLIDASLRPDGTYGATARVSNISEAVAFVGNTLTFWGVPSDSSHDSDRACPGELTPYAGGPICDSGAAPKPLFRNPTSCTAPGVGLPTTVRTDSWLDPGDFKQATFVSHLLPGYPFTPAEWGAPIGIDGCERVPFRPTFNAQPLAGSTAAAPASMAFDVEIPQTNEVDTISQSDLRATVVTLPQGVRVNPSSADGLQGCSSAQIALRSNDAPTCPEAAKIGSVQIDTPLLDVPVKGSVYLATPSDNPFGSLVAIYLVASAQGVTLKLPGQVLLDRDTGRITTMFDNTPQLPFERLHVEFKSGPRSPLAMPRRCGLYNTHVTFVGWNGRTVERDSVFSLNQNARGQPCLPQFTPGFRAGTESNSAGTSSSFLLRLTRGDEDQEVNDLSSELSRGLTGVIALATPCPDVLADANACSATSKIGDVTVGAGAGSNPFFIQSGQAFLTTPYKGGKFGIAITVPAVAGPFDLGIVTVRSALFVDVKTAQVRIVSDAFPTILQGIPLDVRDVRVNVNKPGFFLNPTSCAVKTITARITSTEGAVANVSDRFQAADCGSLGIRAKLRAGGGGRGHTRRGRTTPFNTRLTLPTRGHTNLRFVRVTLPRTLNARLTVINDACTRAEFESDLSKCSHAKAGTAKAVTPLLRDPLSGSVYFVRNGNPIPDLFVALRGEVDFDLVGRITIVNNTRLRTTFAAVPDVPVRTFSLRLFGDAKNGSIGAAANLCSKTSRRHKVEVDYIGQNGKVLQTSEKLKVAGCGKQKHRRSRRRR